MFIVEGFSGVVLSDNKEIECGLLFKLEYIYYIRNGVAYFVMRYLNREVLLNILEGWEKLGWEVGMK